jgi:hypothetical protein
VRLVHDADKIATLEIGNLSLIPDALRKIADGIESGIYGSVGAVMVVIDTPDDLHLEQRGEALSRYEAAGMLALAQRAVFDD